ncbi:hypothetical protein [Litoribacter populi]|uniref:hypothetical protein n=1 Tax=Litoribacter populi TaxID=2598460 RepID=UPI00117C5B5D|nr:hypothetical protein [Litoribacter populi]
MFQINDGSLKPFAKLNFKKPHVNDQGYRRYHIFNIVNTPSHITSNYVGEGGDHFLFLHQKETGRSYNFKSGVLDNQGDRVMLKPLVSEENIYYYSKKQEYTDQSNQEKNPTIGIVRLK